MSCYTLLLPSTAAFAILVGYMVVLTLVACGLQTLGIKVKI